MCVCVYMCVCVCVVRQQIFILAYLSNNKDSFCLYNFIEILVNFLISLLVLGRNW